MTMKPRRRQQAEAALRVVAVGFGLAVGLTGWAAAFSSPPVGRPQVEALTLLMTLGVLAAWAVPGVRWGNALTSVGAAAAAFVAANSVDWVIHHLWRSMFGAPGSAAPGDVLLLRAAVALAAWAVTAMLLRLSSGVLPGPATRSMRRAAVRTIPVGVATGLGLELVSLTLLIGSQIGGSPTSHQVLVGSVASMLAALVVWALVVVATVRPAGLRIGDGVFLAGAGLVCFPLYLLPSMLLDDYRPSPPLMVVLMVAFTGGLTVGTLSARATPPAALADPVTPPG